MTTLSARLLALLSLLGLSSTSTAPTAKRRAPRLRSMAAACALLLLLGAVSIPAHAQTDAESALPTPSAQQAPRVPPPLMSVPTAQYFKNNPAARSQFLAQWKQRSANSARPSEKNFSPAFGGTWQAGTINTLSESGGGQNCNPLLLTDGTVIVSDCGWVGNWYKLTPDITGSYVNGTWTQIATMPVINDVQYAPLANASAVLPDGRVIIMGGEYNWLGNKYSNHEPVWTSLGAIYDPVANTWTPVSPPAGAGWTGTNGNGGIGDAQSTVLADGTFLLAACCGYPDVDALFDATNLTWTGTGAPNAGQLYQDEQGYTLLPNGNILTVDIWTGCSDLNSCDGPNPTNAEQYNPTTGIWSSAGNTVVSLVDPYACGQFEIGPAPLRPDGTVVQFGGNTGCTGDADPTGIYDSTTGVWSAGPNVPEVCGSNGTTQCTLEDSPAAVLPNGNILFAVSAYAGIAADALPTHFFEFTTSNAINQVADDFAGSTFPSSSYNFLVLPNGQILTTVNLDQLEFYTPTGSPDPSWAPVISTSPSSVYPGTTYTITGTQLNGLTQGAYYGDDFQMATNYPIVQITNAATGHVFYGRTFNFSTESVAPGAAVSTNFTVPANIEQGASSLVVIANGIPSAPVPIGIEVPVPGVSVGSSLNPSVYGQPVSFTATVTGANPTGSVQFNIDGGAFGSPVTLASGSATSGTISTLTAATHTVTAVYSGDTNNAEGTGTLAGGQVVNQSTVNVTVGTSPSGLLVSVDGGTPQAAPVVVSWTIGSPHTITALSPQTPVAGTQYTFAIWSDGTTSATDSVTAAANMTGYTASFNTAYLLTTAANPTNGGTVAPPSGTYYAAKMVVNLSASPNPNYAFSNWTGNVANASSASTTVTMTAAESVTANFVAIAPQVTASPSSISFGNVELCRTKAVTVTLQDNASTLVQIGPISLINVTGNPSDFAIRSYSTTGILGPGKGRSYQIQVKFSPSEELAESATLNIVTNAPGSPVQVPITGTGIKGPKGCDLNP